MSRLGIDLPIKIVNDEVELDGISITVEEIERYEREPGRMIDYVYRNMKKKKTVLRFKKVIIVEQKTLDKWI